MPLDKQVKIYSVDTGNFYSNKERRLHQRNHDIRVERNKLKEQIQDIEKVLVLNGYKEEQFKEIRKGNIEVEEFDTCKSIVQEYIKKCQLFEYKTLMAKKTKARLLRLMEEKEVGYNRQLRFFNKDMKPKDSDIIQIFESSLTRTLQMKTNELSEDIMVVKIYYFSILKNILMNGFNYNGNHYIYFTSSAGQIRTKKCVFINERIYKEHEKTLMCGLTVERINELGGNNPNKHLAYLALVNSATDEWKEFDIDKTIVVDDFETDVFGTIDYIDDTTFEITRKEDWIPVPHTDGAGMILPNAFGEKQMNRMIRFPWVKGLLGVFDFKRFIEERGCLPIVKDIYGKEYNIVEDDIQVILTKSQFKLWKYYDSWEDYKNNFKKYKCQACFTNPEEERIKDATINYQMLQSLTDITDEEIKKIAKPSIDSLKYLCSSVETIQECFGATPYNTNLTSFQEAILLYPELLNDVYVRNKLREVKDRMVRRYKSGKLKVRGKYTFVLPDFYAFCEWLFLGDENPKGLLDNGEVFCWLFRKSEKLDCLRSPHLYREHPVRKNMAWDKSEKQGDLREWFITNAIYGSTHDLISKYLMYDVDGDKLLVIADKTIISVAERNMEGIVPLYYNMKKAQPSLLTNEAIYSGLVHAFTGGNIGIYSNNISKIWNDEVFISGTEEEKQRALDCIKCLVCQNNFVIDN